MGEQSSSLEIVLDLNVLLLLLLLVLFGILLEVLEGLDQKLEIFGGFEIILFSLLDIILLDGSELLEKVLIFAPEESWLFILSGSRVINPLIVSP